MRRVEDPASRAPGTTIDMFGAIKILVSVCLLGYLLYAVDWGSATAVLRNVDPVALFFAVLIVSVQVLISAWKWQISLSVHALQWHMGKLLRIIVIASFFKNFLPTGIGGDIYRVYRTLPADGPKSRAVSAVLLERVVGLLSLLFLGAIGEAVIYMHSGDAITRFLILVFALPLIVAAMLPRLLQPTLLRPSLNKLARESKLEFLTDNANLILGQKHRLIYLMCVSLLFQALAILAIVLLFAAVRITGIVAESAVVAVMHAIAALLPISINGLGVMEGSFAFTARDLGINFQSAIIVSLMLRFVMLLVGAAGAIAYLYDGNRRADIAALSASENSPE